MMYASTPFNMCHQGLNDKDIQTAIVKAYRALCPDIVYISPVLSTHTTNTYVAAEVRDRTVVGIISRYLSDHSIGRIFAETIYYLYKNHLELDLYVFYIDDSLDIPLNERPAYDYITSVLRNILGPDRMIHVPPRVYEIRGILTDFRPIMDVLVFTDVGMDLLTYLLSFSRFAYYQVIFVHIIVVWPLIVSYEC